MCNNFACVIQAGAIRHVVCLGFGQSGIWHCEPWQFEEFSIWFLFPYLSVTVVTIVNFPLQSQSISSSNSVLVFDLSQSVFTQVFHLVSVRQMIIKLITVNTYHYVTKSKLPSFQTMVQNATKVIAFIRGALEGKTRKNAFFP